MIKVVAIDDEPPALRIIEHFCNKNQQVKLVKTFTNPAMALDFIRNNQIHLIFIDIQMPGFNGVEFYRNLPNKPMVIFTTAFSEYAVEGFNLNAVDYLLKPYTEERFDTAVQKALDRTKMQENETRTITVKTSYSIKSINIDEILFVESFDDYITIHFVSSEQLEIRMTLKKMTELLPENEFIRVHRSFIISVKHITKVRNKHIYIGDHQIPISNKYEDNFFNHF